MYYFLIMSYAAFVAVCFVIHAIVNFDAFRKKASFNLPALKSYRVFVGSIGVYFLLDFFWGVFEEAKLGVALYVDTVIYFVVMGFTILAWSRYAVDYMQSKGGIGKAILIAGNAFFLAEIILLIINVFHPIMFTVDFETAVYTGYRARNIMLYVQFLLYALLLVYTLFLTIKTKGSFKRKYITISVYSAIMAASIVIQIYDSYLPVYSIGCVLGSVMINSFVISDIKDEYNSALEESKAEIKKGLDELSEARTIAYADPLTNVKNKHAYVEEEERIDALIAQKKMEDFAVVVFDLNGLKHVNDTKGHDAGDVYIVESCKVIERFFGKERLYRFGGDEFVVILEGEAFLNRSKALSDFERYIDECIGTDKPIISSGMSRYRREHDNTYHAVFYRADKIMYARKDTLKEHHSN